ncbi:hypothetical protein D1007_62433 [Hordeum vulgare]|nr:hypothetical protein D1007_62433 [Hordeum vulgare]
MALDRTHVWAQIHDTPELYRREGVLDQLARRIGQVKSVELNPARVFEGNYVRVRAKIKVGEPLVCFTPLKISGEEILLLPVKYEKIGFFCEVCGIMGHSLEECGDGVHGPDEIEYGKWMIAKRRAIPSYQYSQASYSNPPRNRGRGRRSAGDARATPTVRKRSSHEADLSDNENMEDTTESPMKSRTEEQKDGGEAQPLMVISAVRKKLDLATTTTAASVTGMGDAISSEKVPPPPHEHRPSTDNIGDELGDQPWCQASADSIGGGLIDWQASSHSISASLLPQSATSISNRFLDRSQPSMEGGKSSNSVNHGKAKGANVHIPRRSLHAPANSVAPTADVLGVAGAAVIASSTPQEGTSTAVEQPKLTGSRRKRTSDVWDDFKIELINGKWQAICNWCHKPYAAESTSGDINFALQAVQSVLEDEEEIMYDIFGYTGRIDSHDGHLVGNLACTKEALHEGEHQSPAATYSFVNRFIAELGETRPIRPLSHVRAVQAAATGWKPPPMGYAKKNTVSKLDFPGEPRRSNSDAACRAKLFHQHARWRGTRSPGLKSRHLGYWRVNRGPGQFWYTVKDGTCTSLIPFLSLPELIARIWPSWLNYIWPVSVVRFSIVFSGFLFPPRNSSQKMVCF